MDGTLWFLAQLGLLLILAAGGFFGLGWAIRGRGIKQRVGELETRVDEEDRGRRLALEERDEARKSAGSVRDDASVQGVSPKDWEEAQQQLRLFEREILKLNDELKAARTEVSKIRESSERKLSATGEEAANVSKVPTETANGSEMAADDLTRIKGIGVVIARKLNEAGVNRFQQIAEWTDEEVETFSERLSFKGRVTRDRWREQACQLVEG